MEQYEYKVITFETRGFFGGNVDVDLIEEDLNALGEEGWELVSCTNTNQSYGSSKSLVCIFKRKKDYSDYLL